MKLLNANLSLMTVPENTNNRSTRFFGKRILLVIIIILIAGLTVGLLFIFIPESDNASKNNVILPPDCYSVNGEQTCAPAKS